MTKIVHLYPHAATTHFAKTHFIDDLLNHGVNAEFWDISNLFFPDAVISDVVASDAVAKMYDRQELKQRISSEDCKNTIFVLWFYCRWETLWIYRKLFKGKFRTAFFDIGSLPAPQGERGGVRRLVDLMVRGQTKKIFKALAYRAGYNLYGMRNAHYEIVFAAGMGAVRRHEAHSKIIKINHYDYDDFLEINNQADRQKREGYVVFMDQYQGYHPDPILLGRGSVNPEDYQRGVNRFFALIEEKFNVDVIVAAHPKSDYQNGAFNGREVIKYKANELVRDCEFVLGHGSTSLSFAVLYRKPIILLCNNELKALGENSIYPFVEAFSLALGASVYNVDEVSRIEQIAHPSVDQDKYLRYKYEYLTSPQTEGTPSKEILLRFFSEIGACNNDATPSL